MADKDPRRFFTDAQKKHVLQLANYQCQGEHCTDRDLMGKQVEFHHVMRHTDGGPTSIHNCQVLCVDCHRRLKKQFMQTPGAFKLREWQTEALARYAKSREHGQRVFSLEAATGAGKSLFAASLSQQELNSGRNVQHILIAAPWTSLIEDLTGTMRLLNLGVSDKLRKAGIAAIKSVVSGDVTVDTYASLCKPDTVELVRHLYDRCGFRFTMVFDEIHHASGIDGVWGKYASELANFADNIVVMSGTYFRSDAKPIAFLEYDEQGSPKLDFSVPYRDCVANRWCRSVAFQFYDPELIIHSHQSGKSYKRRLSRISLNYTSAKDLAAAKAEVLQPNGEHVQYMIDAAVKATDQMRRKWPDAACLIVCPGDSDRSEERIITQIAKRVEKRSGYHPVVVTCDDSASQYKLGAFRKSSEPYLCAIKMVAEGVNIPRIRVVLFLRFTQSEMLFRQIVGRALRYTQNEDGTAALVIMPRFGIMGEFAQRFESEAKEGELNMRPDPPKPKPSLCQECECSPCICIPEFYCPKCDSDPCKCRVVIGTGETHGGGIYAADEVRQEYIDKAQLILQMCPSHHYANAVQQGDFLQKYDAFGGTLGVDAEQMRENLLGRITRLVGKLASYAYGGDIQEAWKREVHRKTGDDMHTIKTSWQLSQMQSLVESLEKRLEEAL